MVLFKYFPYAYLAAANGPSVDAENHAIQLMFGPLVVGLFFCSNLSSEQVFSLLPKQQNAPEDKVAVLRVLTGIFENNGSSEVWKSENLGIEF